MSDLREQLHQLREEHLDKRYGGDLADDVRRLLSSGAAASSARPAGLRYKSAFWIAGSTGAIAAAIVIVMLLRGRGTSPDSHDQPVAVDVRPTPSPATSQVIPPVAISELPDVPSMPEGISTAPDNLTIVPPFQGLSMPVMPTFPSEDTAASPEKNTSTTRESV